MRDIKIRIKEVKRIFGIDPTTIGIRHRGFWISEEDDGDSEYDKTWCIFIKRIYNGNGEISRRSLN